MITRRAAAAGLATTLIGLPHRVWAQAAPAPESGSGGLNLVLTARRHPRRLLPTSPAVAETWTFNGELSPILRLKQGAELRLTLANETTLPLSLHFHGVRGPNAMDGVAGLTQPPVAPGESFEYRFTPPDAGTFLIRPAVLGGTAEPMERGLSGLMIVEEQVAPQVDRDVALLVDDWRLNEDGSLAPFDPSPQPAPAGRLGNWLSVNGRASPERIEGRPGGRIRLRLANACNARSMRLRLDGMKAHVIAVDGQPTSAFEPLQSSLPFAPGTRYDLLVDLPDRTGESGAVTALLGDGMPLAQIVATGERRPALAPIAPLPPNENLPKVIRLQQAARKDIVITGDPKAPGRPWAINGTVGSPSAAPLLKVKRGTPVVLALNNQSPFPQPMHLHGHAVRLLHRLDDGWEPYFLDTVQVPENRTIRIAFVADNPGKWLLASTVMERFDAGLWTWIEVT